MSINMSTRTVTLYTVVGPDGAELFETYDHDEAVAWSEKRLPRAEPMDPIEALGLGIFAINTWLEPSASSSEDIAYLELHADEALEALDKLRNES